MIKLDINHIIIITHHSGDFDDKTNSIDGTNYRKKNIFIRKVKEKKKVGLTLFDPLVYKQKA